VEDMWHSTCTWKQAFVLSLVLLLERWLGRTPKTKSSSILELTINVIIATIMALISKWRGK